MPDWRTPLATSYVWGLLKAREKPTLRVLHTVAGPVVSFGELCEGRWACWAPDALWRTQWEDLPPGGSLVLDDTVNAKDHTRRTEGTSRCFSGQQGRIVTGQTFLALLYIPPREAPRLLWLQLWDPHGPHKREAARQMIETVLQAGLKPADVSFDGWYFEPAFCNWLTQQGLIWTTRAASRLQFYFSEGRQMTVDAWQQTEPIAKWHYYRDRRLYARATLVAKHGFPPARLVALRHQRHGRVERFLITNDREAGIRTIIARYRRRWAIEVAFRFAKQKLGFSTYRYLTAKAAERHLALVGLAWNFLMALAAQTQIPPGRLKRWVENDTRTDVFSHSPWKGAA